MISRLTRPAASNAQRCPDGLQLYRDEGQTVYLSDDGSVYQTPDPDTGGEILPPEPYEPTLEELQAAKKREISQACETPSIPESMSSCRTDPRSILR